ncbi:endonuclease 8-like 1 [Anolis sagrei]|uniref:endonuclease 8-like 1 n=1 Tax=Anolis sagrei TaxID=38937 RepID=UPI00351F8519
MPEGPELFLTSRYINAACRGLVFSGKVEKSEVSKNPAVPFESQAYLVSSTSRGKELKLTLAPVKREKGSRSPAGEPKAMDVVFRFGMSGGFKLVPASEVPKHAHLRFYSKEKPARVLCYVDVRRFGRWEVDGTWQAERGPCMLLEYQKFRENVLRNLSVDKAFERPICEALLNQKYFNGIGNYLRAEILHRLKIPPFEKARTVLEELQHQEKASDLTLSKKVKLKRENPDLLELCHIVPMEVINLDSGNGHYWDRSEDHTAFEKWLQCYSVPGMKSLSDSNGRTIWFEGDPGPMAPKGGKLRKKRLQVKAAPEVPKEKQSRKWPQVKNEADASSPKMRKPTVPRKQSKASAAPKAAEETRRPRTKAAKGSKGAAVANGARTPKARRKSSALHDSPVTDSGARKKRAQAAVATTRPRRVKAE